MVSTVSSDDGCIGAASSFIRDCCNADARPDIEVLVLLLVLVSTAPDSVVMSRTESSSDDNSSVETGDKTGETIFDVRRLRSEE
jgi:hypothetical protein